MFLKPTCNLTLKAMKYFIQTMEIKGIFQFNIIINVLVKGPVTPWISLNDRVTHEEIS